MASLEHSRRAVIKQDGGCLCTEAVVQTMAMVNMNTNTWDHNIDAELFSVLEHDECNKQEKSCSILLLLSDDMESIFAQLVTSELKSIL
ncbi:unnamed protein product [Schistosoma margrebowiei]|uniref:Uncharacterized protein n=1 Tax=Schistosoma margrebowiei TaxID=48269 RepID=A0AA85ABB6_9TREM|nr:unnamed protein product [Schistosoma margrebowiei]